MAGTASRARASTTRNEAGGRGVRPCAIPVPDGAGARVRFAALFQHDPVWLKQVHGTAIADLDRAKYSGSRCRRLGRAHAEHAFAPS